MKSGIIVAVIMLVALVVRMSAQSAETKKIDEFEDFGCEEVKARTENLYLQLIKTAGSHGYIIVYEGKIRFSWPREHYLLPHIGEANSRIRAIKTYIDFLKISKFPVTILFGGYREHLEAEYFLVPPGGTTPTPLPTLKRIKHRKGRPVFYANPAEC